MVSKHASSSDFLLTWGLDLSSQTWSPNARRRARLHQLGGAPGDHIKLRAILGGRRTSSSHGRHRKTSDRASLRIWGEQLGAIQFCIAFVSSTSLETPKITEEGAFTLSFSTLQILTVAIIPPLDGSNMRSLKALFFLSEADLKRRR